MREGLQSNWLGRADAVCKWGGVDSWMRNAFAVVVRPIKIEGSVSGGCAWKWTRAEVWGYLLEGDSEAGNFVESFESLHQCPWLLLC